MNDTFLENAINIGCSTSNLFAQHCCTMLYSLCANNKDSMINIFILTDNLTDENKDKIKSSLDSFDVKLKFINIEDQDAVFKGFCKYEKFGGYATFYKLLLPEAIDKDIKKIIYIDSDVIVLDSLKELWNLDISDFACAAVKNPYHKNLALKAELNLNPASDYFNCGVLMINLDYWRENQVFEKMREICNKPLPCADQAGLNILLENKCYILDPRWNLIGTYFILAKLYKNKPEKSEYDCLYNGSIISDAVKNPAIIHYTAEKPWSFLCAHQLYKKYWFYLKKTSWSDYTYTDKTINAYFKKSFRKLFVLILSLCPITIKNKLLRKIL